MPEDAARDVRLDPEEAPEDDPEDAPREEAPREEALRDDAPRPDLPRAEAVPRLRDSPDWLALFAPPRPELLAAPFLEDELLDLPVPLPEDEDRAPRDEDDFVPADREELLLCALLLDFCAMKISFPLLCDERACAAGCQDGTQLGLPADDCD